MPLLPPPFPIIEFQTATEHPLTDNFRAGDADDTPANWVKPEPQARPQNAALLQPVPRDRQNLGNNFAPIASLDEVHAPCRFTPHPMKTNRGISRFAGLLLLLGLAVSLNRVQAEVMSISTNSPFLIRSGAGVTTTTENTPVELRGILKGDVGTGTLFGFYDATKKQGGWVKLNEPNKDFPITVRNYDVANDLVSVEYQGRTLNLRLKDIKVDAAPAMAMAGPPRPVPMPGQPAVTQAPSADDTRRLEAVAAEVARRRQARQAAAQQQPQPPQPPPQVTPNVPNRQR